MAKKKQNLRNLRWFLRVSDVRREPGASLLR